MTNSNRDDIWANSEFSNGKCRRGEICTINMNDIYKYRDNEYGGASAIYIYTDSAYNSRVWVKCKYNNRGDSVRGGEKWKRIFSDDDARRKSDSISTIISRDRVSITYSESGITRGAIGSKYNSRAQYISDNIRVRV
jgi:hypothetical protein